jgi:hypothetical protein
MNLENFARIVDRDVEKSHDTHAGFKPGGKINADSVLKEKRTWHLRVGMHPFRITQRCENPALLNPFHAGALGRNPTLSLNRPAVWLR